MMIWWIVAVALLAPAVLVLVVYLLSLRRAIREVADELDEKLQTDTNTLIAISTGDRAVRALAARTKIIVLTDPDGAGTLIRAHLSGILPKDRVIPLYVPALPGKEKRKSAPSAAGLLGVEGQERETLWRLLAPFSLCAPDNQNQKAKNNACTPITKADFFEDGLTGQKNAALRRDALAAAFSLPPGMTPNALLSALNILTTREGYREKLKNL